MRSKGMFLHAVQMVLKNKRSYIMLSVTIAMSFIFFLSYLVYVDSKIMTDYAQDIFSEPYLIDINLSNGKGNVELIVNKLQSMPNTHFYVYNSAYETDNYSGLGHGVYVLPREVWSVYSDLYNRIERIDGKKICLEKNEVLISEERYSEIKKNKKNKKNKEIVEYIPISLRNGNSKYVKVKVVGAYKSSLSAIYGRENWDVIIISNETLEGLDYIKDNTHIMVYTKQPNVVLEETKNMNFLTISTKNRKDEAYKEIRVMAKNKAIIAMVIFLLLGINLYSSFKNALSDRRFEIGVKRAIGASGGDIIKQFLYEGIIVVTANIILSTFTTSVLFSVYKLYLCNVKHIMYIIYISKYSLLIFGIASFFLTVVFSLMFAIQSSKVDIIKYLKAE